MQAAVETRDRETKGEKVEPPKPGSVEDTIAKWIAPVSRARTSPPALSVKNGRSNG